MAAQFDWLVARSRCMGIVLMLFLPMLASAQIQVVDPWVRGTVVGQQATGAFMTLLASEEITLIGASSPAASQVEIHHMIKENDIMRMRAIPELKLHAQTPTILAPGGYHLMLFDIKQPLTKQQAISLTLRFRKRNGIVTQQTFQAQVRQLGEASSHPH